MQAVAAIRNMELQHHEFELRLRDAERLRLYVQSGMAEQEKQSASLKEAELVCRHLELEEKESAERAVWAEAERDVKRHEAAMAKLQIEGAVNTRAQVEFELARVQRALADAENARLRVESERGVAQEVLVVAGEACRKAKEEKIRLADERLALVIELETIKDDFAAFREKAVVDRETMEDEFDARGDTLFNYGYDCCVFTHNICGSKPQISDGMPDPSVPLTPEFFANPRYSPSILSAVPAPDPTAVSKEQCPKNSPTAAGEETTLQMGPSPSSDGGVQDAIVN